MYRTRVLGTDQEFLAGSDFIALTSSYKCNSGDLRHVNAITTIGSLQQAEVLLSERIVDFATLYLHDRGVP